MKCCVKLLLVITTSLITFAVGQQRRYNHMRAPIYYGNSLAASDGWEEWSLWTSCSRSCGGGVKMQRRNCRGRQKPSVATTTCLGTNKNYQVCNAIPCPDGSINTRRAKCAEYNTRLYAGKTYVWEPMTRGGPCQLNCKARGHRFFVRHVSHVTDGTDCSYSMRGGGLGLEKSVKHVCVEGRCMAVGCDMMLSGRTVDRCGVCGGNGKSCRFQQGVFRRQTLKNDFHVVTTIPAGAIRINITETRKTKSYLALRSGSPDGPFYINGELKFGRPDVAKSYQVAGTIFNYERPYMSNKGETIQATGPTTEDLRVMLYYQGENPGIHYEYSLPNPSVPPSDKTVRPQSPGDARHSLLDRHGDLNPTVGASDSRANMGRGYVPLHPQKNPSRLGPSVDRGFYPNPNRFNNFNNPNFHLPPGYPRNNNHMRHGGGDFSSEAMNRRYSPYWPHIKPPSNPAPAARDSVEESSNTRREAIQVNIQREVVGETAWRTQGFGPCSKTCAEGVRVTIVRCVAIATNEQVDERYCSGVRPKVRTRKCKREACPAHYSVGSWSECSRTCGNGRRTRRVVCRQHFPGNFTAVVSHKKCRGMPKPTTHEKCRVQDCASWEVDREWSRCDVNCGTGTQMRRAVCKGGNGETLPDFQCAAARRPSNIRPCDAGSCVTGWYITDWEECSADCDRGVQRRNVYCLNTMKAIAGCPSRDEPDSTRTCARNSCDVKHEWFAGAWGTCSNKCGRGTQERTITCLSVSPDGTVQLPVNTGNRNLCRQEEKPVSQQSCNTQSCGSRWHYTPWSECSVSCGGGSRTRDVQCLDADGAYSSLCNIHERPKEAERCNTVDCLALRDPGCEDTLSQCQMVLQARLCAYTYYRNVCCFTCSSPRLNVRSAPKP